MGFLHPLEDKVLIAVITTSPRSRTPFRIKPQTLKLEAHPPGADRDHLIQYIPS